jgi:CheY-like chemotaxis protein
MQQSSPRLEGMKVLIVDDERDARDLVRRLLEQYGAVIHLAVSAAEGLRQLLREPYNILISDIGMPDRDGYDFIRDVRSLGPENGGDLPAIALTAFARAEERDRALQAGFDEHIPKPVEPSLPVTVIGRLAGASR